MQDRFSAYNFKRSISWTSVQFAYCGWSKLFAVVVLTDVFVQVCTEVCWGLSGSKYRVTPKCKPCRPQTVQTMQTEYFLFLFSFLRLLLTRILFCSCHKLVFNDILECHAQAALARYVTCRIPESSPCSISIDPGFAVINHRTSGSWLLFIQWIEVCSEN